MALTQALSSRVDQSPLAEVEARALTDRIKEQLTGVLPLIAEAFHRRADDALGYQSWDRYCHAEFAGASFPFSQRAERQDAVVQLKREEMTNRAIGQALGIDEKTVRGDLKARNYTDTECTSAGNSADVRRVMSLDGRSRPVTEPAADLREGRAACDDRPVVIAADVKTSPLHYAREAAALVAQIDGEHYGPDDLTAEQLRVLGNLRTALAEASAVLEAEERASIQREEES